MSSVAGRGRGRRVIPNNFAYFALFSWPAVCVLLFVLVPLETAAIWSLLGAYLLLPSNFAVDVSLLPPIDKTSIAAVSTFLLCMMKGKAAGPREHSPFIYLLALAFIVSPIFTSLGNSYELQIPTGSIPGFYPLDGLKFAGRNMIELLPLYIGRRFLWDDRARLQLLRSLPLAALFYSVPMLLEVRLSPQLHGWIYGYYPQSFNMTMRYGGFRPVVFLENGLQVALFVSLALIAAVVALRGKWRIFRLPAGGVAAYLTALLILCKSLGSLFYAVALTPVILFSRPRTWTRFAFAAMVLVWTYPLLRSSSLIPIHHISDIASSISADREASFTYRADNEDLLLAKALQKPAFGWGGWGRNRVYDRDSGRDISVTDGSWIIQFGMFGWAGYISLFGLLAFAALRAMRCVNNELTPANCALGGLALLLAANAIDLLPNSNLNPITFLIAGSILAATRTRTGSPARSVRNQRSATRQLQEVRL